MISKIRKTPIVCLITTIIQLLTGKLRFSKRYFNYAVEMENGKRFVIFRHITIHPLNKTEAGCVFIISFKFARLSHKANKLTSIIPMLMIAGFPGFVTKMYAVNSDDGYWQGMYQWKSIEHLEDYKKSFVFRMMNKRAIQDTIKSVKMINQNLIDIIENKRVYML
jgi:hypothetical protein